jgi:hypothetical protein
MTTQKIRCECCGKQAVSQGAYREDRYTTPLAGARGGSRPGTVICRFCAEDLDEDGFFPEERVFLPEER